MAFDPIQNTKRWQHYASVLKDDVQQRFVPRSGRFGGRVLVNSFPKSGTHLLESILRHVPGLVVPLHRTLRAETSGKIDKIRSIRTGTAVTAHLAYSDDAFDAIQASDVHHFLLFRDPYHVINSHIRYVTEQHRNHPQSAEFLALSSPEERVRLVLEGGRGFDGLAERLSGYMPWRGKTGVTILRFEDLRDAVTTGKPDALAPVFEALNLPWSEEGAATILEKASRNRGLTYSGQRQGTHDWQFDARAREYYLSKVDPTARALGYPPRVFT